MLYLGTKKSPYLIGHFVFAREGAPFSLDFDPVRNTLVTAQESSKIAFVFTGQGAQWSGMGKSLAQESSAFLQSIREMDNTLQQLDESPEWTLEGTRMPRGGLHSVFVAACCTMLMLQQKSSAPTTIPTNTTLKQPSSPSLYVPLSKSP